jgi:hypothetical protein
MTRAVGHLDAQVNSGKNQCCNAVRALYWSGVQPLAVTEERCDAAVPPKKSGSLVPAMRELPLLPSNPEAGHIRCGHRSMQ